MPPEGFMTKVPRADEIVGELLSIPNELLSVKDRVDGTYSVFCALILQILKNVSRV